MHGIQFVRGDHLSIAEGCYLPEAGLLGLVDSNVHNVLFRQPELKPYIPNLLEVDLFTLWDEDKFILFISLGKRGHLPARGKDTKLLPSLRKAGRDLLRALRGFEDISDTEFALSNFSQLGFEPGFVVAGTFPLRAQGAGLDEVRAAAGQEIAKLIQNWAEARRSAVEKSRIFLSHKGVNKPLIDKIDRALRLLNLKTWFDRDDLVAGDPLVRTVDSAFSGCSVAVFFISGQYVDAGVIKREIDRALHEEAMRGDAFKIIPLVLTQHGGSDLNVPEPLRTMTWKNVDDVEIVPTILRALPANAQGLVRYSPPK